MPDVTQIPAPRAPVTDAATNYVGRTWYRFFYNLYAILGSGSLRTGAFYSNANQTAAAPNTPYGVTFSHVSQTGGAYIGTVASRIYVDRPGDYVFQFSLRVESLSGASKNVTVWGEHNGTAITNTARTLTVAGTNAFTVAAWALPRRLAAKDYVRIVWMATDVDVRLAAAAASTPIPESPSAILTVAANIGE